MPILKIADTAGFCFGVKRSVEMAEKLLAEDGKCTCLGELIHNESVIRDLESRGLTIIHDVNEVRSGERVIIRAHGAPKSTFAYLESVGAEIVDATCPKVMAIHKIVDNASKNGRTVLIIGTRNHPEVEGIQGWCEGSVILSNPWETEQFLASHPEFCDKEITVVVQTTQTRDNFNECVNRIKKMCTKAEVFDTICLATSTRQKEAAELAAVCDAMIVIGGKQSANSVHLAEICSQYCDNVQFVEAASELDRGRFIGCEIIGLTAGASTPEWIIKEVSKQMSDEIKEVQTPEEQSFLEMLEETLKPIYNGEKVSGIVAAINGTEVAVDLGTKYSGVIAAEEFTPNGEKLESVVKIGDTVEAIVKKVRELDGIAELSKKQLDDRKFWETVEASVESGEPLEGTVVEENKGGVVVNVNGIRVFVPASQTDLPKEADLAELLKQKVKLRITEVNKARKRVVGSIRKAAQADRKAAAEAIWNDIEVGKKYLGTVKSMTNYGAFVDIGGIDGMVHVTELGWGRIHNPAEVVKVGDELEVYVINFDKDARRISLGYKDPNENPWKKFEEKYAEGDVAECKIVKLMPFGAFAEVCEGVDGLIHISQLALKRIASAAEAVHVGDIVNAKITAIDHEKQKISLSIRALLNPEEDFEPEDEEPAEEAEEVPAEE